MDDKVLWVLGHLSMSVNVEKSFLIATICPLSMEVVLSLIKDAQKLNLRAIAPP